jgi:hypothetical protein
MQREKWALYSSVFAAGEGPDGTPPKENANDDIRRREFVEHFASWLGTGGRVLAPGALAEAVLLVESGFEVYAQVLPGPNATWLKSRRSTLAHPERLVVVEQDAHDLDYPADFFDGYFSVQFNEHLMSWFVHLGEVRHCMRPGAIAFVDACGTTNPAMKTIQHINLISEIGVENQWQYWGWKTLWRGPLVGRLGETGGDGRPQFVFEKLPDDSAAWAHREHLVEIMKKREGLS